MADIRGVQQKIGQRLTVIDGGRHCAGGELAEWEESLAGVLDQWTPLLEPGCDPLSAELTGAEFPAMMREAVPVENELSELVAALIGQAEGHWPCCGCWPWSARQRCALRRPGLRIDWWRLGSPILRGDGPWSAAGRPMFWVCR